MAIATGSKHTLHYIAESTYGTTPSTPTWTPICHSACTLGMTKDAIEDDCLSSNRQVKGLRHGNRQVGGEVGVETHLRVTIKLLPPAPPPLTSLRNDRLSAGLMVRDADEEE